MQSGAPREMAGLAPAQEDCAAVFWRGKGRPFLEGQGWLSLVYIQAWPPDCQVTGLRQGGVRLVTAAVQAERHYPAAAAASSLPCSHLPSAPPSSLPCSHVPSAPSSSLPCSHLPSAPSTMQQPQPAAYLGGERGDGGVHAVLGVQEQGGDAGRSNAVKQGDVQPKRERPASHGRGACRR